MTRSACGKRLESVLADEGLSAVFLYLKYWGRSIFPELEQPQWLGFRTAEWMFYWSIYQSFVHFYYDGFLWKMRTPDVRATI